MATVTPSRSAPPVKVTRPTTGVETVTIASGDDLELLKRPGEEHRAIIVTPSDEVTPIASLTDGDFVGQRLTLIAVDPNNVLRLPAALANLNSQSGVSVAAEAPATLVWNGAAWDVLALAPERRSAKATFDFAVDGGGVGAIVPVGGLNLPDNAIVLDGHIEVETTLTSPTADAATIALSIEGADDLVAAVDIADGGDPWDAGLQAVIPVGTVATFIKLSAGRDLTVTIAVEDITAGKFHVWLDYVIGHA